MNDPAERLLLATRLASNLPEPPPVPSHFGFELTAPEVAILVDLLERRLRTDNMLGALLDTLAHSCR